MDLRSVNMATEKIRQEKICIIRKGNFAENMFVSVNNGERKKNTQLKIYF